MSSGRRRRTFARRRRSGAISTSSPRRAGKEFAGYDELQALVGHRPRGLLGRRSGTSSTCARTRPTSGCSARARCPAPSGSRARAQLRRAHGRRRRGPRRHRGPRAARRRATPVELTFGELREQVARARAGLQRLGVGPGDRVVAYLPNIPETLVAFLATASLGAVWASCAPEFGPRSVIDRFAQLEPKRAARGRRLPLRRQGDRPARRGRRGPRRRCRRSSTSSTCPIGGATTRCRTPSSGTSCSREPGRSSSTRCRSTTRSTCSSRRARPACRRRSSTATAASCSSTSRTTGCSWDLQPRRPAAVVHDDRLDDVERARLGAAAARLDRDARRQPAATPTSARSGGSPSETRPTLIGASPRRT